MFGALVNASVAAHDIAALTVSSLANAGYALRRNRLLFKQLHEVGNRSLVIVSLMGLFIGMSLALQSGYQLRKFNQEDFIGIVGIAIVKEFGPVITAFLLAGRIGSAYAAEIGTMKVYEEVDALTVLGVRPVAYLASPRLLACLIMMPILVIYADFVAVIGGALIAKSYVGVEPKVFFQQFFQWMDMTEVWRSMIKCVVFGGIVAITGCYFGFRTKGGAEGVGRSATDSVVFAILAVLVCDYFLEKVLLAL